MSESSWRYCVTREVLPDGTDWYAVREVYTSADGALSWTEDAIAPEGESWKEIGSTLALMAGASNGRVLDLAADPPRLVHPRELAATPSEPTP